MTTFPPGVRLETSPPLDRIVIDRPACKAEIFLRGAHVTSWVPRGHDDVLFTSPSALYTRDKAIRGGIPICLPWFGARPAGQHGFARITTWMCCELVEVGERIRVGFLLLGDGTRPGFPHKFGAHYIVTLGETLECALEMTNRDTHAFEYEDAFHTYFSVGDVREARVSGLEGASYLDHARGDEPRISEDRAFSAVGETDRLYLGGRSSGTLARRRSDRSQT